MDARKMQPGDRVVIVEPLPGREEDEQRHQFNVIKSVDADNCGFELERPAPPWMRQGCLISLQDDILRTN